MVFLVTAFLSLLCVHFITVAAKRRDARHLVMGVLGLFAFGHYVLPVIFRPLSQLRNVTDDDMIVVISMVSIFLLSIWLGFYSSGRLAKPPTGSQQKRSGLDALLFRRPIASFSFFAVLYFLYLANSIQTIYQAGGAENYYRQLGTLSAGLSTLSGLASAGMAITLAYLTTQGRRLLFVVLLGIYLLSLLLLLGTAQRSAVITPVISLAVAFALFGQTKAMKFTIGGAIVLLIVASPFLVLMRGTNAPSSVSALAALNLDNGVQTTFLVSILDRADALLNMVALKDRIDNTGFANVQYFYSIIVSYIPSFLYPGKPTAMSETGTIDGHLSVIAWRLVFKDNSLGSLTTFGPMIAYHEGGWPWLIVNGLLTGAAFNLLYGWLANRSYWRRIVYVAIFPLLCVSNVPPSFFQLLTSLSTTFYIFSFLGVLSILLRPYLRSKSTSNGYPIIARVQAVPV